jgi:ribonucleoside-diphosphate reductase alpha chain
MSEKKDISTKILSDIVVHMKYAKYIPELERRETWEELVTRNKDMHIQKYPKLKEEIEENYKYVYEKKVMPSMRSLQFSGKPIEINPVRSYNCSAILMDHPDVFSEVCFLLLSGTGVGYSVQKSHVSKLPPIKKPIPPEDNRHRKKRYLIGDSIEGWADSIKVLMKSYFEGTKEIEFDYRDIRPKGERLITSGGKAPGPQPLKDCIHNIRKVLDIAIETRGEHTKLKPIEVHDIACFIADCILSGGIRRAACISFFSLDDDEMMSCKFGNWWEQNPQRARSNNSVLLLRHKIKKEDFSNIWEKIKLSGSGEPGIVLSNDRNVIGNPCMEISLKGNQFCNLTTINVSNILNQEDFNKRCQVASFLGTLQSGYLDFHYLRDEWNDVTEKDNLIGVSMTGIANKKFLKNINISEGAEQVNEENKRVSKLIGVKKSSRTTTVKPEGSSSLVCESSSGIHAWFAPYYIRRIRVGKNEALYQYLYLNHTELVEDEFFKPNEQAVISIPVKAPEDSIFRTETPLDTLKRVKKIHEEWIKIGHRKGSNTNNVSTTINIKDDEWNKVGKWMWENKDSYNGISVLPYDGGSYKQAPFEEIDEKTYNKLIKKLKEVDLTKVIELTDNVDLKDNLACSGGACEIK